MTLWWELKTFCRAIQYIFKEYSKVLSFPHENADPQWRRQSASKKKVSKLPILILIPLSQKPFYVYQLKHEFLQIHNGWGKTPPNHNRTFQSVHKLTTSKNNPPKVVSYLLWTNWCVSLTGFYHIYICHVAVQKWWLKTTTMWFIYAGSILLWNEWK